MQKISKDVLETVLLMVREIMANKYREILAIGPRDLGQKRSERSVATDYNYICLQAYVFIKFFLQNKSVNSLNENNDGKVNYYHNQ